LTASGQVPYSDAGAGIGGNAGESSGNININGGNITAIGGGGAAGIGGGFDGDCGNIIIAGGNVTATGTGGPGWYTSGSGIGSGGKLSNPGWSGGSITITGDANVTATGGSGGTSYAGAGIGGGGNDASSASSCPTVINTTGVVIATGGTGATASGADIGQGGSQAGHGMPLFPVYEVLFSVVDTGTAVGSTISATYGGNPINDGDLVSGGQTLVITATGAGAVTYAYAWSGAGTGGQRTQSLQIILTGNVDALCTVTGSDAAPIVPVKDYYITATSDSNSTISPKGMTVITKGGSQTYMFTPASGYSISSVMVDGRPIPKEDVALGKYTFLDMKANHTIDVKSIQNNIPLKINIKEGKGHAEYSVNGSPFVVYSSQVMIPNHANVTIRAVADDSNLFRKWETPAVQTTSEIVFNDVTSSLQVDLFLSDERSSDSDSGIPLWQIAVIIVVVVVIIGVAAAVFMHRGKTK
jgi:hypothetical protein